MSAIHARFALGQKDSLVDEQSSNGCFVNGQRIDTSFPLFEGDILQFGEVAFFFTLVLHAVSASEIGPGRTQPVSALRGPFYARLTLDESDFELVEEPPGGALRSRGGLCVRFSRMEFSLLRRLVECQREMQHDSFVSWSTLAVGLEFRSIDVGRDNLKELVKRVRRKAKQHGLLALISSSRGQGYQLNGLS